MFVVNQSLKSWIASSDLSDTMSVTETSQIRNSDVFRSDDEADVNTCKNGQDFHGCYCSFMALCVQIDRISVPIETILIQARKGTASMFGVVI